MQVGICESFKSKGMRQSLIETMGASQTRGIEESEKTDQKPVMKMSVCNGNSTLSERTTVDDKNNEFVTYPTQPHQEYLNLAVSNLDLVIPGSRKNGNIPDIVNFSPYKGTLLNKEELNEKNLTAEKINENKHDCMIKDCHNEKENHCGAEKIGELTHDSMVIDDPCKQDSLCYHGNRTNDLGAIENDTIQGNCFITNQVQTTALESEILFHENPDNFQNLTDIPESSSKDDGIEVNSIGHYDVPQSGSLEVFVDNELELCNRKNSFNREIQHFERNGVRLSNITQESGFYDHYNQNECILIEGDENNDIPISTLESGFVDHDVATDNFEISDSEFHDCDLYVTNSFENQNLYVHDSSSIGWESNYMCTCDECLKHLRIERIQTEDKCTMCPDEPPYVLMCEICEGLLENQLQKTEKEAKKKHEEYKKEIKELKSENKKQQKIIGENLTLPPDAKIEATMQHEITRLTSENLDLREIVDKQTDQIRKLKKMLKVYAKRLKEGEAAEIAAELEKDETQTSVSNVATVKHRERNYMGMLEYKKEDESVLIKNLIMDLKPKVAMGLLPGLPAYVLFMCVRHTDYINDDEKVRSLLTSTINGIKKCVKKHHEDLDRVTLWLANTCRLLHTLKQYSGEKSFQSENTPRQNEHCLRNFDLSEYRQVFSDLAVWIYQTLIKLMQEAIQPMIVPAVLEHEAIAGLSASKPSGMRGRTTSTSREIDDTRELSLDSLMKCMNKYSQVLVQHAVDPELVKQIFRQLYYYCGAGALNNLLLRKDMCNWSKGMQIRYNLSHLEQWLRDNKLNESGAQNTLDPIIQASQLLQARKTDADVDSICEMCSKLTTPQIVKILNLYTPVDEFEERVPISFIRNIQAKLKNREESDNTLLMDTKYSFPVTFPFNPSSVAMETIDIPQQLHLGFVTRV